MASLVTRPSHNLRLTRSSRSFKKASLEIPVVSSADSIAAVGSTWKNSSVARGGLLLSELWLVLGNSSVPASGSTASVASTVAIASTWPWQSPREPVPAVSEASAEATAEGSI